MKVTCYLDILDILHIKMTKKTKNCEKCGNEFDTWEDEDLCTKCRNEENDKKY